MTALMPNYSFRENGHNGKNLASRNGDATISGLLGGIIVLLFCLLLGFILKKRRVNRGE